jgi:hypothetical protein
VECRAEVTFVVSQAPGERSPRPRRNSRRVSSSLDSAFQMASS